MFVAASYNIHSCVGNDRRYDPARIATVIREIGADSVALQEADARERSQGFIDQWDYLAQATGSFVGFGRDKLSRHLWSGRGSTDTSWIWFGTYRANREL